MPFASSRLKQNILHYTFSNRYLVPNSLWQEEARENNPFISPCFPYSKVLFVSLNLEDRISLMKLCCAKWVVTGIQTRVAEGGCMCVCELELFDECQSFRQFIHHLRTVKHTHRHAHVSNPLVSRGKRRQTSCNSLN